jgi:hypothetical protein
MMIAPVIGISEPAGPYKHIDRPKQPNPKDFVAG